MDYESIAISKAIIDNAVGEIIDKGIKDDYFVTNLSVWQFVLWSYREHGGPPSIEIVQQHFPSFEVKKSDAPVGLIVDELKKRHIHNAMRESLRGMARLMEKAKPLDAFGLMKETVLRIQADEDSSRDVNLVENTEARLSEYNDIAKCEGMIGIPTPWKMLNEATLGLQSEDLIMLAGRSGVGKTWSEVVFACTEWMMGYVPLVISNEMSVKQMVRRIDATCAKLPYKRFRAGMLSGEELERWERSLRDMKDGLPFWVSGDRRQLTVTGIRAKVRKYKPNVLWIDGGYLLSDESHGRQSWERWSNVCGQLKRLGQDEGIPVGISHQFNLEGRGSEGSADTLKYGDVKMWFDLILGMYQTDELRLNKEMLFRVLKIRESEEFNVEWVSGWDLDAMEFPDKGPGTEEVKRAQEVMVTEEIDY
jgi:hypothetical protein